MNKNETSSNGFGSFNFFLMVVVDKPYGKVLIDNGWEVSKTNQLTTTFKYHFKARKSGDDETALFELGHTIPEEVPMENYRVDWENSNY